MDLAVIIPVFNAEKYLEKCIESVRRQNVSSLEIILVDDGSTDSSSGLCDKYAQIDERIKAFHKKRGGLMSAWKYGLLRASADYIGFVDSDDWIDDNMYSVLLKTANTYNADIVAANLIKEFIDNRSSLKVDSLLKEGFYDSEKVHSCIFPVLFSGNNYHTRGLQPHRVTKIFRREVLINCVEFCSDEVSIGEDLLTLFGSLQKAKSIYILSSFFPYHYRIHTESMINKYSDLKYEQINLLRKHLLLVNSFFDYDFKKQINTDYLKLVLMQIENEILFSGREINELKNHIKSLYYSETFSDARHNSEIAKMPFKYKLYMFLIRNGLYRLFIFIRLKVKA